MSYNINEPIDVIYSSIDDLCEIAEMVIKPYTQEQLVDLGYILIANQSVFHSDLRQWIRCPPTDQTWQQFMTFFWNAHHTLRETEASMDEISYQSANTIVSQIVEQLRATGEENDNLLEPPAETPSFAQP